MIDFEALAGELTNQVPSSPDAQEEAAASLTAGTPKKTKIDPAQFGGRAVAPATADKAAASAAAMGGKRLDPVDMKKALEAVKDRSATPESKFSLLKTLGNVPGSAGRLVSDIGSLIAHPVQAAKGIASVAAGGVQKLIPGEQGQEAAFDGLAQYYKDRYGSVDNLLKTIQEDPVGFALDASGVLTLGGTTLGKVGATAALEAGGQASRLAGIGARAARAGAAVSRAGEAIDPFAQAVKAVGKGVGKIAAPFAGAFKEDIAKTAAGAGVDLPISAQTESRVLQQGEAIASKGVFGQPIIDSIDAAHKATKAFLMSAVEKIDPSGASAEFMQHAGEVIASGFEAVKKTFDDEKTRLYDSVADQLAGVKATASSLEKAAAEIVSSKGESMMRRGISSEVQGLLDNIRLQKEKVAPSGQGMLALDETLPGGPFTYEQLKETRSAIGEKLNSRDPVITTGDKAVYEKLYAAVSKDMDAALMKHSPELAKEVGKANKFFSEGVNLLKSKTAKNLQRTINDGQISRVVDVLVKPGALERVQKAKVLIGKENVPMLQAAFLRKIMDQAMVGGALSGSKLAALIDSYGVPVLEELLTKDQFSKLMDARELALAIQSGTKVAAGSQTAFLTRLGTYGGLAFINPAFLVRLLMGDFAVSKLLTTKWGKQYLTTGSTLGNAVSKAIKDSAKKAGQAAFLAQQAKAAMEK